MKLALPSEMSGSSNDCQPHKDGEPVSDSGCIPQSLGAQHTSGEGMGMISHKSLEKQRQETAWLEKEPGAKTGRASVKQSLI